HHRASPRLYTQSLLPGSSRVRPRPLHRASAADSGRLRRRARPARAWDRVPLEGAGGLPGLVFRLRSQDKNVPLSPVRGEGRVRGVSVKSCSTARRPPPPPPPLRGGGGR